MPHESGNDNIRRIRREQIEVGMYITEFSDHRAVESGLRAQGLVTREETVKTLRQMEVSHVYIDISKGGDCADSESVGAMTRRQEEKLRQLSVENQCLPTVSFDEEYQNAVQVQHRAQELIRDVMQDVKMGRGFDSSAVDAITVEITRSLSANQNALNSLMRVRSMDRYLLEHSTNVAVLMGVLARSMGIFGDKLHALVFGAFVHDIGKIRVPADILDKPGRLDPAEWQEMKRHVVYGIESLRGVSGVPGDALEICAQHHERLDGAGYPFNLPAQKISHHGRMAAVVDVYDAITADRVYHRGTEPTKALKKMLEWSGEHLDRELVYQLIRSIGVYPAGAWVILTSGLVAMVREVNWKSPKRSTVLLTYDSGRGGRVEEQVVNLAATDSYGEIRAAVSPLDYGLRTADYLSR